MSFHPSDIQLDALREVANIGCGHAASALSRLLGNRPVRVSVPRAVVTRAAEVAELLGGGETPVVAVKLGMEGPLRGVVLLMLPVAELMTMEWLLGQSDAGLEERESALAEAANIAASACLSAIGTMTGWRLMPTVPVLVRGLASAVLPAVVVEVDGEVERVVVLETRLSAACAAALSGRLLMVLEREDSRSLLAHLGV